MVRDLLKATIPLITNETRAKPLTDADSCNLEVFDAISSLNQSFELLERSQSFATLIPSAKYLNGLNINRHDWLEYQVSTFLITFVTVSDQAVLLVNDVFCLGIAPKDCKATVVKNNKWVKDTSIPKQLDAIKKVIERHCKARHLLVHEGKTPSLDTLFKSKNFDQLKAISFAVQHAPEKFSGEFKAKLDESYVKVVIKINKTLDSEICQLRAAVWQLLTDLHKFYSQRLSILSGSVASESSTS